LDRRRAGHEGAGSNGAHQRGQLFPRHEVWGCLGFRLHPEFQI
jgi:hypothetical protein